MPKINDAMAFTEEDSGVIGVVIPFEQKDTGEPAEIVWVYDPETGTVMVMLANDFWCSLACTLICTLGPEALCIAYPPSCAVILAYFAYYGDDACGILCGQILC